MAHVETRAGGDAAARAARARFEHLFPEIFEKSVDGILLTNTDGTIYAANPAACAIFMRSEAEMCRLGRSGLLNLEDARLAAAIEERRRTGHFHAEFTILRGDGRIVPLEVTSSVLGGAGPEQRPAVIFFRDISERNRAREELARERSMLDRVFAGLEDAVLVVDSGARRIMRANPAACRLFGWSAEELVGRETSDLYPSLEAFEQAGRQTTAALRGGEAAAGELMLRRRDGTEFPVRYYGRIVDQLPGGVPLGIWVLRDLTAEKRAQSERAKLQSVLFQAQKLESLGVLAAGIAHDFNNLLVAMLANATTSAAALPPDDATRAALEDIAAAARSAGELVRQLMAFSGRSSGTREPIDLAAAVRETTEIVRASAPRKIATRTELPPMPLPVLGDAAQLRQAVVNLVLNAGEAIGEAEGQIVVSAGVETCAEGHPALALAEPRLEPGRYAWIQVNDDGPGMAPEVATRALDPFFSTKGLGRGLGLAAVAGIARVHGGALEIDTAPGRGTRVRLWIPSEASAASTRPRADKVTARGRVLVADDEPLVRRAARRLLESSGFLVAEAVDGADALERFRNDPAAFDVVVLDLSMPRLSGEEAFEAMRRIRPDLPVVLSSGYSDAGPMERLKTDPHVGFAPKPYDRQALLGAVSTARG